MIRPPLAVACLALLLAAAPVAAQESASRSLPLDGTIAPDGRSVTLDWSGTDRLRVATVTVSRRRLGETGGRSWRAIAPDLGRALRYTDEAVRPGVPYEYRVERADRAVVDAGFWATGTALPAVEARGHAHLVVDETVAGPLGVRLDRMERDLVGDGWRVSRLLAPRGGAGGPAAELERALEVRGTLAERHAADPFARHAVILLGHVPVVRSGRANPDGHDLRPHATDLFYADADGRWSVDPLGQVLDSRVPSDFIEMQVGRIDFAGLSDGDPARELQLLRAYLDKLHHWRHGLHGDLRRAYGQNGMLEVERHGLRNVVGQGAVTEGGHHDAGEDGPWLWGVDFGDHAGGNYAGRYANEAVFAINFGSGKQTFDGPFNAMTALLAQPWYTIAVGWGGRPSWRLHVMALGGTIGDVHMATVNNGRAAEPWHETMDYHPTGQYLWQNPVWVNLLGDPTARPFVLAPPTRVRAEPDGTGVALAWTASRDPDATGAHVYRLSAGGAAPVRLTGPDPVTGTTFRDPAPEPGARYMVRAAGLKRVNAGSLHTLSQGAFAQVGTLPLVAEPLRVEVAAGEAVALPRGFGGDGDGPVRAVVAGPEAGTLEQDGAAWVYRAPEGYAGEVRVRYTLSDAWRTDEGVLTIAVSR